MPLNRNFSLIIFLIFLSSFLNVYSQQAQDTVIDGVVAVVGGIWY